MRFVFLIIAILFNFFNHTFIKSQENIESSKNTIENIAKKESINEEKTDIKKIHVVKSGDTCLLYTSPSPRDLYRSRMPSSA